MRAKGFPVKHEDGGVGAPPTIARGEALSRSTQSRENMKFLILTTREVDATEDV